MTIENKLLAAIVEGIREKKGGKIVIADLTSIDTAPCAYFVICEGNSPQQVEAITDSIEETARLKAAEKPQPWRAWKMPSGWLWTMEM